MTKRDQILRAWIDRPGTHANWTSYVSYRGKVHERTTNTTLRQAAKIFCDLHAKHVLFPDQPDPSAPKEVQVPLPF